MENKKWAMNLSCSKNLCRTYINYIYVKYLLTTRPTRAFTQYDKSDMWIIIVTIFQFSSILGISKWA